MQRTASLAQPRPQERRRSRPEDRRPGATGTAGGPAPPGLVPFDLAHLADLEPPPLLRGSLRLFALAYLPGGPALTFIIGDKVVGCAGLTIDGDQARLWAFLTAPLSRRAVHRLHRAFKEALPALLRLYGLESIVAEAHPDHAVSRRWLAFLGFRFDGVGPPCPMLGERLLRYIYR